MIYEELKIRPSNGSIDHNAITAWLETKDYAFLDPIEHRIWHLSASKQEMEVNRHERVATPTRMPKGVFVLLMPDPCERQSVLGGERRGASAGILPVARQQGRVDDSA